MCMKNNSEISSEKNAVKTGGRRHSLTARDIAMIGMMTAVIVASKEALSFLPNIELVSFWMIMFTLYFGWRVWFVVPIFIILECAIYSFGIWNLMYLLAWPVLVLIAWLLRRVDSAWLWAIISGAFGLSYGFLCTLVYAFFMIRSSGVAVGLSTAAAWWVAGIPYDIVHCIGNFALMLALYHPIRKVMSILINGRAE